MNKHLSLLVAGLGIGVLANAAVLRAEDAPPAHPAPITDLKPVEPPPSLSRTILENLKEDGHYKILVKALQGTDTEKSLSGEGTYTFFAPTDKAFEKLPELAKLQADKEQMGQLLNHHLIEKRMYDLIELRSATSIKPKMGDAIKVEAKNDHIQVDGNNIVSGDIRSSNGVAHGIDSVLMKK